MKALALDVSPGFLENRQHCRMWSKSWPTAPSPGPIWCISLREKSNWEELNTSDELQASKACQASHAVSDPSLRYKRVRVAFPEMPRTLISPNIKIHQCGVKAGTLKTGKNRQVFKRGSENKASVTTWENFQEATALIMIPSLKKKKRKRNKDKWKVQCVRMATRWNLFLVSLKSAHCMCSKWGLMGHQRVVRMKLNETDKKDGS